MIVTAVSGWLLGRLNTKVPLWLVALAAGLAIIATMLLTGRANAGKARLYAYYAEHLRECLETFQKVLAGAIPGVNVADYIERGVLGPARQWLARRRDEDVRLSIIVPAGESFKMLFEAGHSLEARENFHLPLEGSFAGRAFVSGKTEWSNDVEKDSRWSRHPQARAHRRYGSLVSTPVRSGAETVGVLNVLSTRTKAFRPADLAYIELLAGLVNVVWSLDLEAAEQEDA